MSISPGSRLGPYEILAPIGAGGMGEVYRARDTRLGRDVAVKVLPASFSQDADRLRRFEQEARAAAEAQLRNTPDDANTHALLGLALTFLGDRHKAEAVREGERGVALVPVAKDAYDGPYYQHQLARIYIRVNEPEKALDQLEPLLEIPYYLSPGWLRIDPTFAPLKGNPRFQQLVAGK